MVDLDQSSRASAENLADPGRASVRDAVDRTILTPGQKTRVFISSTLGELEHERLVARDAIKSLRLEPVYFGDGARPLPPPAIYRGLLQQCPIFVGIYWNEYGQIVPGMEISGIEDEYNLSEGRDRLIYIKQPTRDRDGSLKALLKRIRDEGAVSYLKFSSNDELFELIANDLARLQAERYADATVTSLQSGPPRLTRPLLPIVDRSREVGELVRILKNNAIRLVTLTGPGGVGKTRLAREAALNVEDEYVDGATFADLSGASDPEFVLPAIIAALGMAAPVGQTAADFLRTTLSDKRFLLLLTCPPKTGPGIMRVLRSTKLQGGRDAEESLQRRTDRRHPQRARGW